MAVDYTEDVVEPLGNGLTAASGSGSFTPESLKWDCSIGGLDFLFGTSKENPMRRETSKFRRERIDTQRDPGENSLDSGLWVRSQASWHYGAGLSSAEPLEIDAAEARFRYFKSGGVNPWTPGQLTLLNSTESVLSDAGATQNVLGINTGVLHTSNAVLKYIANDDTVTTITAGNSGTLNSLTSSGQYWIVCDDQGIYKGAEPSGAGAKIYDKDGTVTSSVVRWIKSRLMYAENNKIFEITNLAPSSATLPTVHFTHEDPDWVWTDFSEGPSAIYASGYSGELSAIYRITIEVTASTVTLGQPTVVVEMPRSEQVISMYSYVGSFIVVGTSSGCRVAAIQSDASLVIGPLLFEDTVVDDAVAFENYVYVTVRDKGEVGANVQRAGLYRIDLGQVIGTGSLTFAHAADLTVPTGATGNATSVTTSNGLLWFSVTGSGVYRQTSAFVDSGWIQTGRIRLGTMENKAWRDLRIIGENNLSGTIAAYASISGAGNPSDWEPIITATNSNPDIQGKLSPAAPLPAPDLHVALELKPNAGKTASSVMIGYQLRAVPSPRRNELVSVPLMLFDWETDRSGVKYGQVNGAYFRFQGLKNMELIGNPIQFKDNTTGEIFSAYIEQIAYARNTPPSNGLNRSGSGGVCTVLLRTV